LDLLTLCNQYLEDANVSWVGHDTFARKQRSDGGTYRAKR
jgi:hypothetical protein